MAADTIPHLPVDKPPLQDAIRAEAVRQLYLSVKGVALLPLFPTLLVAATWSHITHSLALAWLACAVLVLEGRRRFCIHYFKVAPKPQDAARWGRYMTLSTGVDGLLWGIAGIFFYIPDNLSLQMLLLTLLVGIPAGSIHSTSWWPATHRAYSIPAVGLTAIGLFARGDVGEIGMGVGLIGYLVMLHFIMREANGSAMETIALRFEKQDLVDQLQQEKEVAERANLAKSKFLAAASHDLRQPLHAMTLFVAAMEDSARYPETKGMLGNIQRCTTALEALLQTLLDISKIDAGVIEPQITDFHVTRLVEQLAAEFGPQAKAAGLDFATQCGDFAIHSDPALVERILRNLINNAIRYTPTGSVAIRCHADDDKVTIEVIDTGVGIPVDQHERVFDEFTQLGNPERDRTKGLGLGLAIVRRLAALLHATVVLESAPGRGSAFRITLPRGSPVTHAEQTVPADHSPSSLQGTIVAVIDDEADVREGMRTLLDGWGCRVVAGEDAESVIAQASATGIVPDILLADYRLRDNATGVQAIEAVRAHFGRDIPAAIITGDTAPERLAEAQASGHLLLHKPLRPAKLRVLLQNLKRRVERPT
jgi:two-component system, sensor histidine kinase